MKGDASYKETSIVHGDYFLSSRDHWNDWKEWEPAS